MEGSVPDSMLIREIDALRAERDKAIADLEKIETFLRDREEFGQWQADALCRMLKIERGPETMSEFNLEARWINLGEREPNHDDEVFARKTAEDFLTVIYFAEEGDIKYSINGESYIFEDQMDQWEWLELRQKEEPEPAVPLPDGIHEVTLPDGQSAFISDSGGYYGPAFPLPDGRMLVVHEFANLADMFDLQAELNEHLDASMIAVAEKGDERDIAKWTQNLATAMQQELAELVDCVPWKWWANYQKYDRQNARVEIVDLFHFLISMAQLHGMTAQDVFEAYKAKCEINHKRHESGYTEKDPDDCRGI